MFDKIPKLFWVCFFAIYINAAFWWMMEAANPSLPKTFIMGAPAAFWYGAVWSIVIFNVILAWLLSKT